MNNATYSFDEKEGTISGIRIHDGLRHHDILFENVKVCYLPSLELKMHKTEEQPSGLKKIQSVHESSDFRVTAEYEVHARGYVICTFMIETIRDNDMDEGIKVGINLDAISVFSHAYEIKNSCDDTTFRYDRAFSVNFSTDDRPVTNSVDFILENLEGGKKIQIDSEKSRFLGWEIMIPEIRREGAIYRNRWCITATGINNGPNPVRGQRIIHFNSLWPRLPDEMTMIEMAEYGCSVLVLHMPAFKHIDGSVPFDEKQFIKTIDKAHDLGMKVLFYSQPVLISLSSPMYDKLSQFVNDNGRLRWNSLKDTKIIFYEPHSEYDCDELCLRCEQAYDYMKNSILQCYNKYGFDGLYIDFAWPGQAVCTDESHHHEPEIYDFHDYLRMIRELRESIGPDAMMIGHGGSIMVSSDFVEGFDGCLTGEGQKDISPVTIGVQNGNAPTLWTFHRRKQDTFRSMASMTRIIREGITLHVGLGILGKSIIATLDPAHTPQYIAYWQMLRAFPVHEATFYNYLTDKVLTLDNEEITYSLYVTKKQQLLLIICNGGGPIAEKMFSVGVNIQLDMEKLNIEKTMTCHRMNGNTYETFRITEQKNCLNGLIHVEEIGIHEFMGFILTAGELPKETTDLMNHLKDRFERMSVINKHKMERLINSDRLLTEFEDFASPKKEMEADLLMTKRVAE